MTTTTGKQNKRIAIFLDGTWNEGGHNTNVWRSYSLCAPVAGDGMRQVTYYDIGVNGFLGGTFGDGVAENVLHAYEWLVSQYDPGDEIFIFGFSRGAYTARSLAGFVAKYGLIVPGSPISTNQIFDRYKRPEEETIWKLSEEDEFGNRVIKKGELTTEERWMRKYSQPVPIKMVGVWDTVGALGVPALAIEGISRRTLNWLHTGMRQSIEHGFHALAIDEHRKPFSPTLWTYREGIKAKPRSLQSVEQRWFVGCHTNVGGGYVSDFLAQPPLRWIVGKAAELGLEFRYPIDLDGNVLKAKIRDSHAEFLKGWYQHVSHRRHRMIGVPPREDPDDSVHHTINETIDRSVFERWRSLGSYRPQSLTEWAKRKNVEPESVKSSITVDGETVPDEPRAIALERSDD